MQITIERDQIILTATMDDLRSMLDLGHRVYGTPNDGETQINQAYVAEQPHWTLDRPIAHLDDFLEEAGWDDLDGDPADDDQYITVTVQLPRAIEEKYK